MFFQTLYLAENCFWSYLLCCASFTGTAVHSGAHEASHNPSGAKPHDYHAAAHHSE